MVNYSHVNTHWSFGKVNTNFVFKYLIAYLLLTDNTLTDDTLTDNTLTDDTLTDNTLTDDTLTDDTLTIYHFSY